MRPVLASALALMVAACAGGGVDISGRPTLEAAAARLPASVAGFNRGDTVWHERERPGYGVAVEFAGPSRAAVATVTLYDRGQGAIPDRAGDARVANEFAGSVREVLAVADTRTNHRIAERERREIAVPGGAPLSCARLEGTYGRQEVGTLVCVGAAAGRFLKVQVIAPARQVRPVDPVPFVVAVTQAARGA